MRKYRGTVFTDVEAAIEEAAYLADSTKVIHLLIQADDGCLYVIKEDEEFTGRVLEKFYS